MNHQRKAFPLRMPLELREWAEVQAEKNERSLSSEIVHRLKESKARDEQSNAVQ